jgi:glycosyltransferase involved in cell wall biosynthesis
LKAVNFTFAAYVYYTSVTHPKKKIALIVQRYGTEVNGGAELHCRQIAEHLSAEYNVEVLTSCAKDHISWFDEYKAGVTDINGVSVRRFPTGNPHNRKKLRLVTRKLYKKRTYQKLLRFLGLNKLNQAAITDKDYAGWVQYQGPYLLKLIQYLKEHESRFDALIFFTYLYYPTIEGLKIAPQKSILIPTAHDEPPIYFPIFKQVFNSPKAILYNTRSEKGFMNGLFNNESVYSDIAGVGIDVPDPAGNINVGGITGNNDDYIVYIGRVDALKGCAMLFEYLIQYNQTAPKPIKLILAGKATMHIPADKNITALGFVDEDIKNALLQNARALVMPSFYESLSLVTLESMAYGIPVIANQNCEVLKDHIENSKAGFLFTDFTSFKTALDTLFDPKTNLDSIHRNAKAYVAQNYTWAATLQKYRKAIEYVCND